MDMYWIRELIHFSFELMIYGDNTEKWQKLNNMLCDFNGK